MKIAIKTLGCKVNQYESTSIVSEISAYSGIELVPFEKFADIYFINSCAVTSTAGQKSRKYVARARKISPDATIIALGCYGELEPDALREAGADHIIKNSKKSDIINTLIDLNLIDLRNLKHAASRVGRKREIIKVQDGCDQFCSYCIIPYLRGKSASSLPAQVLGDIVKADADGAKEVVITGIHLGKYGQDLDKETDLLALLKAILNKTGIQRVRLSSIEPFEIDERLLDLAAASPRIADHLHIPLQSGSDKILKAMNRPYTRAQYLDVIDRVKGLSKEIAITTDVMVGFPGETEDDLEETISLIRSIGFSKLHVFKYSDRPLTKSSNLTDKVSADVKGNRAKKVREIGREISRDITLSQIGKTMTVAVTGGGSDGLFKGKSSNYMDVLMRSKTNIASDMIEVKITDSSGEILIGEII